MNSRVQIGDLRHCAQFLNPLTGRDENGSEVHTWVASQELWCKLDYKLAGSDEKEAGARIQAFTRVIVTMRYIEAINAKMRLWFDQHEWNIQTIAKGSHRRWMEIDCMQTTPRTAENWTDPDGFNWTDPNGNPWLWVDPSQTLANNTGLNWTDNEGYTWTPKQDLE